ncbi:MAG TPA: CNNM domain-containing protein, partial [Verrucomicrobiae bacterium]
MRVLFVLLFSVCLAVSFLLSGMESGVFALSRLRVRRLMRDGNRRAAALYDYLENPENFLWTIFVGNIVANVLAFGIIVLALHKWLHPWPALWGMALAVSMIVFYSLCELLPKMLFRMYPNRLSLALALPFGVVHFAMKPIVALMTLFSRGLLRWTGGQRFTGHLFGNRDELRIVMQESAQGMTREERAMINRVLDLQNFSVRQVLVPIDRTVSVSNETAIKEVLPLCRETGHSRLPVWRQDGSRKRIIGLLNLRQVLFGEPVDENRPAGDFVKPALYLNEDLRLEIALRRMQRSGHRLAIVLDHTGREAGIV